MAIDRRRPNRAPEYLKENNDVYGKWTGTYIGIVRRTVDTQRMGRLLVYIPQITPQDKDQHWISVSYATPFYGFTDPNYDRPEHTQVPTNIFTEVKHSYGMWFVPPDPGVKVLITFVNGDLNKGYWFACLPEGHNHHMVPSLGATSKSDYKVGDVQIPATSRPDQVPTAEYNDIQTSEDRKGTWALNEKPLHKTQFNILESQGLEFDYYRGAIKSGSQRETPSGTFGISTPGRPAPDFADNAQASSKLAKGTQSGGIIDADVTPKYRKGGHTLVMDDGELLGSNNFFRIKTGSGHQVLLHDSGKFIYISNSKGTAWVELNDRGDIELFAEGNFSLRSASSINLHADKNINMYAGNEIKIVGEDSIKTDSRILNMRSAEGTHLSSNTLFLIKAGTTLNLDGTTKTSIRSSGLLALTGEPIYLNSGGTTAVATLPGIKRKSFPNSIPFGPGYKTIDRRLSSIVDRAPIHEPDPNHYQISTQKGGVNHSSLSAGVVDKNAGRIPSVSGPIGVVGKGTGDQTKNISSGKTSGLKGYYAKQPDPSGPVAGMTADEYKAYAAGLGKYESGGHANQYAAENKYGYVGKYQFGAQALQDQGLIKPGIETRYSKLGAAGHKALLDNPDNWTTNNPYGVSSKEEWINSPSAQEAVLEKFTDTNYKTLNRTGGIRKGDDSGTIAGMLQSSHLLGAGRATRWRASDGTSSEKFSDANNTPAKTYFDAGRSAINTLTKDGTTSA